MNTKIQIATLAFAALAAASYQEVAPGYDNAPAAPYVPQAVNQYANEVDHYGRATEEVNTGVTTPGESTPGESTPGESTPGESTPGESTPGASTPGSSVPGESTPGSSAPGESTPGSSAPGESTPAP
ncbi:hypothetical protein IW137_005755, partial [Coemansia sp. RSA 1287]